MRTLTRHLSMIAASMMLAGVCAAEPDAAGAPADAARIADDNQLICKREYVLGSSIPKRVCLTKAQRREMQEAAQRNMKDMQRGGSRNVPREG